MRTPGRWVGAALAGLVLVASLACGDDAAPGTPAEQYDAGLEALEQGDAEAAEVLFTVMVEADPTDPVARSGLARALARQDRLAEAIIQDKLAYALDPRLAEVAYNVACSYARLGREEEGLRWLSRAWNGGIRDLNVIEQDPDLDALRRDHRFAFFLATGALSLAEREAVVEVSPALVSPGQQVRVELTVVSLNRPLMAAPERIALRFEGELRAGVLTPLRRMERFEAGESGGREYFRRELAFEFVANEPLETMVGPFELTLDGEELPVRPAWLSVREVLPDLFARRSGSAGSGAAPDAGSWFDPPSAHTAGGDHPFVRWEERPVAGEGDAGVALAGRDLVVGVTVATSGIDVPDDLELELPEECDVWAHPRTTAFLRTRAEGDSRIWFHRGLVGSPPPGETLAGCPDPLVVRVIRGDEVVFEGELAW